MADKTPFGAILQCMLTRAQVARRLRKSIATVRRMEGVRLHPTCDVDGVWHFDVDEVESCVRAQVSRGTQCAADRQQFSFDSVQGRTASAGTVDKFRDAVLRVQQLQEINTELKRA